MVYERQPPNQGTEESQPNFALPNPPSEVEPHGLQAASPTQGAEEPQPTFGLPSPPSEVEPSGLRTTPPTRVWRNPSKVLVYRTHHQRLNPIGFFC